MLKRKIISLCLLFAMTAAMLSACAKAGNTEPGQSDSEPAAAAGQSQEEQGGQGKGRFIESDIELPEGIDSVLALSKLTDGSLEAVGMVKDSNVYYLLKSSDLGENWEAVPIQGLGEDYYPQVAVAPDGSAAFIPYTKDGVSNIKIADLNGLVTETAVEMPTRGNDGSENHIYQAAFDKEGSLIAQDAQSLLKIDLSTGSYTEPFDLQGENINYFGVAGTQCLAVHEKGIFLYDTSTAEKKDSSDVLDDMVTQDPSLASMDTDRGVPVVFGEGEGENTVVYANKQGIFYLADGGSVSEQLADSSLTSLGGSDLVFFGVAMADKEHIVVCASGSDGAKLLRYVYDANASATPEEQLNIYALDESAVLRQAVIAFQKSHPDVYVNLQIGLSGDDGVTLEDALTVLNTDIMAKKGPDILILDGMPVDSYIEKGVLEDISDVINDIDQSEGIFANIKKASEQDGHIYAMPLRFLVPLVEGAGNAVTAGADLKTLADEAESLKAADASADIMPDRGARVLLRELYYADSASWMKEDGTLDEGALKNYFEQAKRLYDVDRYEENPDKGAYYEVETFEGTKTGTLDATRGLTDSPKIAVGTLEGIFNLQTLTSTQAASGTSYGVLNGGKVRSFVPYLQVGVAANGNTELSREFVKELFGKEQNKDGNGWPVNKTAYDAIMEDSKKETEMSLGFSDPDGNEVGLQMIPLTDENISKFTETVESLTSSALMDRTIRNLITEQGEKYLLGEQSLEDTVSAALQKVNLYLTE